MRKINIAIDGASSSGKSSTGELLAKKLNYDFLDTGLMYRAITLIFLNKKVDINDSETLLKYLDQFQYLRSGDKIDTGIEIINVNDLTSKDVTSNVALFSKISVIREKLIAIQKEMAINKEMIMVGRDITSVVLPEAELRIFLTASPEKRVQRRLEQNQTKVNTFRDYDNLKNQINNRDKIDITRKESSLTDKNCNLKIDNSNYSLEEVVQLILDNVNDLTK